MTDQLNVPYQPPPKKRGLPWWGWVLIGFGGLVTVCMVGAVAVVLAADPTVTQEPSQDGGVISNSDNRENPPVDDVSLTDCVIGEFGWAAATLEITNNSSKASSYMITVEVVDGDGNRLEEAFTFIEALRPDQSTVAQAQGLEDVSEASGVDCVLLSVDRYSSEG